MLKVVGKVGDRTMLAFGLTERNRELLWNGRPIEVDGRDLGYPGFLFVIFGGKDELDLADQLKKAGFVLPTIISTPGTA